MFSSILIFLFFLGVMYAYVAGVKKRAPWGKPVVAICTLGLVISLVGKIATGGNEGAEIAAVQESAEALPYEAAKMMAGELKRIDSEAGGKVFLLGQFPSEQAPGSMRMFEYWHRGISEGFGATPWEKAGYWGPAADASTEDISTAISRKKIDVLISFQGLPANLHKLSIYKKSNPPKVAAYFPPEGSVDTEIVGRWLLKGLVQVVVLKEDDGLKVYTSDNLP